MSASGDWVNAQRVRLVCLLLLAATILSYAMLLATSHGTLDSTGRQIGTDFSDVYAAGWMADHRRAAAVWVWPEQYKVQLQRTVQANLISAGSIDTTFNTSPTTTSNLNHVNAYTYLNFYLSQKIGKFELFGSMRNALNIAPPPIPNPALYSATDGVYYDTIGRYFTAGVRVEF